MQLRGVSAEYSQAMAQFSYLKTAIYMPNAYSHHPLRGPPISVKDSIHTQTPAKCPTHPRQCTLNPKPPPCSSSSFHQSKLSNTPPTTPPAPVSETPTSAAAPASPTKTPTDDPSRTRRPSSLSLGSGSSCAGRGRRCARRGTIHRGCCL